MNRRDAIQRAGLVLGYAVSAPVLAGLLKGCKPVPELTYKPIFFNEDQARIVSEVAEIIIPKTDTPGAKDTGIPAFIDQLVKECYNKADQDRFLSGIKTFDEEAKKTYGDSFIELSAEKKLEYVKKVHDLAITQNKALEEVRKSLIGKKYIDPFSKEIIDKYGSPDSVKHPDNKKRMTYFPKGDFNLETDKFNDEILSVSRKAPFILITKELTVVGFFTSQKGAEEVLQYDPVPGAYKGCLPLAEVGKTWAT